MHTFRLFIIAAFCAWAPYCDAQVTYEHAKGIFAAGGQDFCFDGPYYAHSNDRWLALVSRGTRWSLETAVVSDGRVSARGGRPRFFIKWKDQAFFPGPVTSSKIISIKARTRLLGEEKFSLGGKIWRWIEWGADSFYLAQGAMTWTPSDDWYIPNVGTLALGHPVVPLKIRSSKDQYRDLESPGRMQLVWAGDLNGDLHPELVTFRQVKEAWSLMLWSSFIDRDGTMKLRLIAAEDDGCD